MTTTIRQDDYVAYLKDHYGPLVRQHGGTHRAVNWGSQRGQETRFRVLLEAGGFETARLLDIGCGVGHLVDELVRRNFSGHYRGVDLVPEMVAAARRRHGDWEFCEGDFGPLAAEFQPDYIVASGLFNTADQARLEATVTAMFATTRRVLAFNSLSAWGSQPEPGEFCAEPEKILAFCRTLTRRVVLRHDYLPHDFTIYLYREDIPS